MAEVRSPKGSAQAAAGLPLRCAGSFLTAYVTPLGLRIGANTQVFGWERDAQRRFARYACKDATRIVNVGYGLGFAHQIFEAAPKLHVHLIEQNLVVYRRAMQKSSNPSTQFHLGDWEACLPSLLDPGTTVFFDAYPDDRYFSYSARDFSKYLS